MTKSEYQDKRMALLDEAEQLINNGDLDGSQVKMEEVTALDDEWETTRINLANLASLRDNVPSLDIATPTAGSPRPGVVDDTRAHDDAPMTAEDAIKSDVYVNAWAKELTHKAMTTAEADAYKMVNDAYTHTTDNTSAVIPTTVVNGIWEEVEDMYPFYADIVKTYVPGNLQLLKGDTSSEAAWYVESTEIADGTETFVTATLSGCELARSITVSWKLQDMAIEDFIPYIQRRIAVEMGKGCGYGAVQGAGPSATPPEPLGIITGIKANAPDQVVEYTTGALSYTDLTAARAKIKSGYASGLNLYANSATIWGELVNVLDNNARPILLDDVSTANGVARVLGMTVKEDGSLKDGEILLANPNEYQMNIQRNMTLVTEDHAKTRTTDYVAYADMDGAPITYLAFSLLTTESGIATAKVATASTKSK